MKETRFKDTEVGKIPVDWEIIKFDKAFTFYPTNTLSRDMLCEEGSVYNIHYGDVLIKYCSVLDAERESIPAIKNSDNFKPVYTIKNGDIIIADTAEDETVGKVCEVQNVGTKNIVSGLHTMWVRPIEDTFSASYLGYAMNGSVYHDQLIPFIQGTKVSSISKAAIENTYILLPPPQEQHRIASALTDIDELISSLDKLIAKKKDIKQGAMQQLLTGKVRLKGFAEPWVEKKLGDCAITTSGGTPSRSMTEFYKGNINWFTTGELSDGYLYESNEKITQEALDSSSAKIVPANTLLMAMYGATIGKLGILQIPSATNQACCAILCKYIETKFLFYILLHNRSSIIEQGCGAGQPNISQEIVKELHFYVPSSLAEQRAIATILTDMDNELTTLEAKRSKYAMLKDGMMQQLLTGKIRLTD